jgi:O-antigen/teichoic acid export membrane protein
MTGAPAETHLGRATAGGAMWLGASGVFIQVLAFVSGVIVARHVTDDAYGTAAAAMVVVMLGQVFVTFGFAPAIASGRMTGEGAISSAHWLVAGGGLVLAATVFALSPLAARFFHNEAVAPTLAVASLALLFGAWEVVPQAVIQARSRFDLVAIVSVVAQAVASIVAVAMAIAGFGVWVLVIPTLAGALVRAVAFFALSRMRLRLRFAAREVRPHLGECGNVIGASVSDYLFMSMDRVIMGRMLGQALLGRYVFAQSLVGRSLSVLSRTLAAPLLTSLGQLRVDLARFDRAVVRSCLAVARLTFPISVGGAILAPELLEVLVGERWLPATTLVRIFFLLGAIQSVGQLSGSVWLALGKARLLFVYGLITNTGLVGAFFLGALAGTPEAVASAFALYCVGVLTPVCVWVTRRFCGIPLRGLGAGLLRVSRDALGMAAVVLACDGLLERAGAAPVVRLLAGTAAGAATYALLFRLVAAKELGDLLAVVPHRLGLLGARMFHMPPPAAR